VRVRVAELGVTATACDAVTDWTTHNPANMRDVSPFVRSTGACTCADAISVGGTTNDEAASAETESTMDGHGGIAI